MDKGTIDASKVIFQKVFSADFWFLIPEYQRSYVWQTDNISELVEDLAFALENKPSSEYFLGSLVLKRLPDSAYKEYEVLDGQQRLTTFFIMMAVIRDLIEDGKAKNTIHSKIYQEENMLENIPARMRITYRIRDGVEGFVNTYLIQDGGTNNSVELEKYKESDNVSLANMANAITVLKNMFADLEQSALLEYVKYVFNKAIFIYVSTENTEDAFRLFSILNDRGIPLTNADILKAQNIGALDSEKDVSKYARIWEEIEGKHGESFDRFLQFIRTILVQEKARVNLLEEFNEKIYSANSPNTPKLRKGKETFELINEYNDVYENMIELEDPNLSNEFKNLITIMKIGYRSDDWIPPLMHYYYRFGTENIDRFLSKLEYKFTGDWVCGVSPTTRVEAMNAILKGIDNTDYTRIENLLEQSSLFDVDQAEFRHCITGNIYKKQYVRYLLLKLEFLLSDNTVHLSSYNYITVEHVLPQNPPKDSQWGKDFNDDAREYWTNRIANLVLISKRKNSALSNSDFAKKKAIYLNKRIDAFQANKVFIENESEWTPRTLSKRQEEMVEHLVINK